MSRGIAGLIFVFGAIFSWHFSATAHPEQPVLTHYRLWFPERKWAIELDLPTLNDPTAARNAGVLSFSDAVDSFSPEGNAALLQASGTALKPARIRFLTISIVPALATVNADELRELTLKSYKSGARHAKIWDYHNIKIAQYETDKSLASVFLLRPGDHEIPSSQSLEAYLVKSNLWAKVTLSGDSLDKADETVFYSILDSIGFVEVIQLSISSDFYQLGKSLQLKGNYQRAAEAFDNALKLEKRQPQLNGPRRRRLVRDASEVQIKLSNLSNAAQILEYGLNKDPTDTDLLMRLAQTYAMQGEKDKTLAVLEKCFYYMKREKAVFDKQISPGVISHTSLPDLNDDPAFKGLMKDKAFRDAVKAIKK